MLRLDNNKASFHTNKAGFQGANVGLESGHGFKGSANFSPRSPFGLLHLVQQPVFRAGCFEGSGNRVGLCRGSFGLLGRGALGFDDGVLPAALLGSNDRRFILWMMVSRSEMDRDGGLTLPSSSSLVSTLISARAGSLAVNSRLTWFIPSLMGVNWMVLSPMGSTG